MCAYYDIYLSAAQRGKCFFLLSRCAEAREHVYMNGEAAHTRENSAVMLHCKNGGWNKYRCLLAVRHCLECRAERNLCLSEAHISAEQSVHRAAVLHISLDIGHGCYLTVGLLVLKCTLELSLHIIVRRECMSRSALALGIQSYQFLCHLACGSLCFCFCLTPFASAEL